jgi:hypothetical protein
VEIGKKGRLMCSYLELSSGGYLEKRRGVRKKRAMDEKKNKVKGRGQVMQRNGP